MERTWIFSVILNRKWAAFFRAASYAFKIYLQSLLLNYSLSYKLIAFLGVSAKSLALLVFVKSMDFFFFFENLLHHY